MKNILIAIVTSIIFLSCVEEYKLPAKVTKEYEAEVVVQGRILAGEESVVYVSYTTPFNQEETVAPVIRDAQVIVIGKNGYRSELAKYEPENNCYVVDTHNVTNETQYAIEVKVDGETYQSEYLDIQDSPEIDEVTYKEHNDGISDGISIHVTTLADDEDSRHYMWSYEEDWEFHAEIDITNTPNQIPIYDKEFYPLENPKVNPYYYCWMHAVSRNVNLYSTQELNENKVNDIELTHIPIDDIRISYIYSILVKQWSLSDAAYNYYKTLKRYTEESDGLFAPMPAEIQGNVSCISNPKKKARGYVLASNVKSKRIFIYHSEFKTIVPLYENCQEEIPEQSLDYEKSWPDRIDDLAWVALTKNGYLDWDSKLYSRYCVNCQQTKGATKKRPDFWPNNHE